MLKEINEMSHEYNEIKNESRKDDTKQLITLTKEATGMDVKTGQAALQTRAKCSDSTEAQLGQCMWIPSLFQVHQENDPEETCLCETEPCS